MCAKVVEFSIHKCVLFILISQFDSLVVDVGMESTNLRFVLLALDCLFPLEGGKSGKW